MRRLTNSEKAKYYNDRVAEDYCLDDDTLRYAKLGQLEDIEEELGIEVTDFFKLTKAEKIYLPRFKAYYQIDAIDLKTMEIIVSNKKKIPPQHTVKIRNYGKTWLFDKKEKNE